MLDWIKNKTQKNRKDFGKYNFFVKSSPQSIDSSTTLTLTTYTNNSQAATIPCRYRWSIIKNGLTIQVPEFKGSSYKCEPSDVGAVIQAEVISTDMQYGGTAVIQFGPVKLDVSLKKQIQMALSTGSTTMPVYLCNNGQEKQCQIRLYQDLIKINHAYSETNYTFDYTIFEPRVECVSKDSCRMVIVFSEKYESELRRFTKKLFDDSNKELFSSSVKSTHSSKNLNMPHSQQQQQHMFQSAGNMNSLNSTNNKLDIKFMNRNSRDIFLFAMKAFNTKKQLRSSIILTKIQKIDFSNQQTFDYLMQIQSLKSQLVKMDTVIKKSYQQKLKYMEQVRKLQKEIEEIIITYTRIVQQKFKNNVELSRDYSMLSQKRDEVLNKKYRNLQNQNNHLNSRIQALTKQIDAIRFKPTSPALTQSNNINTLPPQIPPAQNPQQKVYFNYENYISPFSKKRSGLEDQSNVVGNILDQLGESRISAISSVNNQDKQLKLKLEQTEREKQQLQKKLQKSFHKIDSLEKDLFMKQQFITSQGHKLSQSAVHFVYAKGNNDSLASITQHQAVNVTSVQIDREKQSLIFENKQLKKSNQVLKSQRQHLIQQLKNSKNKQSPLDRSLVIKPAEQLDNSLNFLKTQKKDSNLTQREKQLIQTVARKDSQIKLLKMQNQELKKTNQKLRKTLQQIKSNSVQNDKLQKKVRQLEEEIEMYRKNSDALNRSQQLSMEMENYNEEQITMLKQHNEFLTTENEKLSRACERYMGEAKESNKLRMEIIKLKQRINELQLLNQSSTVILTS